VLDEEAKRTDVDVAFGQPRAERVNDGLGGLARRAVADRDVRSPARGLAIRCVRPGDLMGCRARGVVTRQFSVAKEDVAQQGSPTDGRISLRRMVTVSGLASPKTPGASEIPS
jgi:hypothetical protein